MTRKRNDDGALVVIEGANCTGKTVTLETLVSRLDTEPKPVTTFHFPSGDADDRLSEMLDETRTMDPALFIALTAVDRLSKRAAIEERLAAGHIVICDRYTPSGRAYGRALGLEEAWLDSLEKPMPNPDQVFVLDVPLEELRQRIQEEPTQDYFERRPELLEATRDAYRDLSSTADKDHHWHMICGLADVSEITEEIIAEL